MVPKSDQVVVHRMDLLVRDRRKDDERGKGEIKGGASCDPVGACK